MIKSERVQQSLLRYLRKRLLDHCSSYICLFDVPEDIHRKFSLIVTSARAKRRFRSLSIFEFEVCVQTVYSCDVLPILKEKE